MGSFTASSDSSGRDADRPGRPLWQAPFFAVGVAALVFVGLTRPTLGNVAGRRLDRELSAVRKLLTRPDGELEEVVHRAGAALETARVTAPDRVGEAHFLLGSALVCLTEHAEADRSATGWRAARTHLEEAERLGVADVDRSRLQFRLLKAAANTGDAAEALLARLRKIEPPEEDREAYYRLLSDTCLRLTPPDLAGALDANNKMRPFVAEDHLAEAQLRSGELLLRLRRPGDARKDLEKIGPQAPASVRTHALLLKGQSYQDEGNWMRAAEAWQQTLSEAPAGLPDRPLVLYQLGVCYRQLGQPNDRDAPRLWEECIRTARGDEGAAAALCLAEVAVQGDDPARAVEFVNRAVRDVQRPEEWKNAFIDLPGARGRVERVVQGLREAAKFDLAVQASRAYQRLAPTESMLLAAESMASGARQRRERSRQISDEGKRVEEETAARDLFRQAGDAFTQAAAVRSDETVLWKAAGCFLDAGDAVKQREALHRSLDVTSNKVRKAESWYLLGDSWRRQNDDKNADEAYRNCIQENEEPFASRARYQLAMLMMARGEMDDARDTLEQTLRQLRVFRDSDTQEKTLFALGRLFYHRQDYRMAATRLEEVLGRAAPGPEVIRARWLLAASYRRLGSQQEQNDLFKSESTNPETVKFYQDEHRRWLHKAALEYRELRLALEQPENRGHLSPAEEIQVPFLEAECWFDHGGENHQYQEALDQYTQLAQRYAGSLEGLSAMGGLVRCYSAREEADKMKQCVNEIREALKNFEEPVRVEWEKWLSRAGFSAAKQ